MTTQEQQGFTERTQRNLSDEEIRTFQEHGVVRVRSAVTPDWIDKMIPVIDEQMAKPSQWSGDTNPGSKTGRFLHDRYLWPEHGGFRHFVFHSGVGRLAAQALRSSTARIYFDHIFVKEPETAETFLWHQDIPYWPFRGSQICSVWLALTAANVEAGDALIFNTHIVHSSRGNSSRTRRRALDAMVRR